MANLIRPRGFVPTRYLNGAAWNGAANLYHIPAADTNQYNVGDAVKSSANSDANGIPDVVKITNGTDTVRGVIIGCLRQTPMNPSLVGINLDLTVQNIPAAKLQDYWVLVVDDPQVCFLLQDDGTTVLSAVDVNLNASFTVVNPTAPMQNSATVLNTASPAATAGLNLKILGLAQYPDNAFGAYAVWVVKFNQHEFQGNTAGA